MSKAKEAFFDAKQQIKDALAYRIEKLSEKVETLAKEGADVHGHIAAKSELKAYEEIHSFVRNCVLYEVGKYE